MSRTREGKLQTTAHPSARIRLLKAAIRLFAERGYEGASIRDIADAAGANCSLISFHFGGKAGLHAAALRLACRKARHHVKTLPAAPAHTGPGPFEPAIHRQAVIALRAYIWEFIRISVHGQSEQHLDPGADLERAVLVFVAKSMIYPPEGSMESLLEAMHPYLEYLSRCMRVLRSDLDLDGLVRMGMSIHAQLHFSLCHRGILDRLLSELPGYEHDLTQLANHFLLFTLNGLGIPDRHFDFEAVYEC